MEYKNFTKKEFNAATTELVKIAREFVKDDVGTSLSLSTEYTTMYVFEGHTIICVFSIHRQRFVAIESCKALIDAAEKANVTLKGKYIQMILEKYKEEERIEGYMPF